MSANDFHTTRDILLTQIDAATATLRDLRACLAQAPDPLPRADHITAVALAQIAAKALTHEDAGVAPVLARTLVAALFAAGDTEAATATWKARIQNITQSRVVPERLIAAGVAPDVVAAATVKTTSKPFIRLYPLEPET